MAALKRKSTLKKQRSPLRKSSAKEAQAKREYKKVCDEIDREMWDDIGYIRCTSCEARSTGYNGVAHSHLLPKGNYKQFETEKWNISPRCLDCHRALDDHSFEDIQYFKDLDNIMDTLAIKEPLVYNRFVTGLQEVGCNTYNHINTGK